MLAAQNPGLWQNPFVPGAPQMSAEQGSLDVEAIQRAIRQQQAIQLQLQNFLLLQQTGCNPAQKLSQLSALFPDIQKSSQSDESRTPSPGNQEESKEKNSNEPTATDFMNQVLL